MRSDNQNLSAEDIVNRLLSPVNEGLSPDQVASHLGELFEAGAPASVVVQTNLSSATPQVVEMWRDGDTLHISVEEPKSGASTEPTF